MFLKIYGVTQDPETKEYMIVMQYADNGSLLSYLDQNINKLTWRMKLIRLRDIADYLSDIHSAELAHCDLHPPIKSIRHCSKLLVKHMKKKFFLKSRPCVFAM